MSDFEQEPEEYDVQDEVKELLARGREQGFLTYEEIHEALPEHALEGDKYDEMIALIVEMGIDVVESAQEDGGVIATDDEEEVPSAAALNEAEIGRTTDPVRMYMREMGAVDLLTREGEIAIAKRIEAGRETMISGLCESPLTFQALIIWRDELNEGTTLLREIIDLETTYSGPEAKAAPQFQSPEKIEADRKAAEEKEKTRKLRAPTGDEDVTDVGGDGLPPE